MYYTNELTITMRNEEMAVKAFWILLMRLGEGFECDKTYKKSPSLKMIEALEVRDNTIILPDDYGCYIAKDASVVMSELMEVLATALKEEVISCQCWNCEDDFDIDYEAQYENGILTIKAVTYPNGYIEFLYCDDCEEEIVKVADYNRDKKYFCAKCGKEVDLFAQYEEVIPFTTEKEIKIK